MADTEIKYTVKQPAKITVLNEKPRDPRPSACLAVIKWIFAGFLAIAVLSCVVASKISLLAIGAYSNITALPPKVRAETSSNTDKETIFIMIVLVMIIPPGLSFLRACWVSLFTSSHPWPSNSALVWCILSSLIEVAALSYFAIWAVMHSTMSAAHCILIMNAVFFAPIAWYIWKTRRNCREHWKSSLAFVISFILEIVSIVLIAVELHYKDESLVIKLAIPISVIFLSLAWSPKVQKLMVVPRGFEDVEVTNQNEESLATTAGLSVANDTSIAPIVPTTSPALVGDEMTARGKAGIVTGLIKLVLTPFFAALFEFLYDQYGGSGGIDFSKLGDGFSDLNTSHAAFPHFMAQIFTSLGGYVFGWLACAMCLQKVAFALPLILATPVSFALVFIPHLCETSAIPFHCDPNQPINLLIPLAVCLWLAQLLWTGCYIWQEQTFVMARESSLFWLPFYNGVFLEQNLILNRKNEITDEYYVNQRVIAQNACVYICTTMYHETEIEMKQLLHSLHDIDTARATSKRQFESHVFFDGAVKGEVLNDFVLQLIALIPKTLKVRIDGVMKIKTPYGMQMRWRLPGGMPFHIHLKDNLKVKNKKRWSQTMYMSYILDYKEATQGSTDENTYILATDADVEFTHESVQALLDMLMRDPRVGAVCGRTHPLGSGPIVWYQVFDYAIGHWFQKTANHVLGSVLCSPGCFSAYRCRAVRDVLPTYATSVTSSNEFLTKDMGEDRWFCTLLVQSGWRLEYCAVAEDWTYCPDTFDEFFRQRRRWIPSTLANLVQLIGSWKTTTENNDVISIWFIAYQALNVFSTLICPATVILIVSGALRYVGIGIHDDVVPLVLMTLTAVGFAFVCLYAKQEFQLKVAKLLTIIFALIMAFTTVGMAAQIGVDLKLRYSPKPTSSPTPPTAAPYTRITPTPKTTPTTAKRLLEELSIDVTTTLSTASHVPTALISTPTTPYVDLADRLPADVSTLYLAGLVGIFLVSGLFHPFEAYCLVHGVWYLLCLPSGYLLLIIYSICNMTDRSWGTRETKERKITEELPWYKELWNTIKYVFTCCRVEPKPDPSTSSNQQPERPTSPEGTMSDASTFYEDDPMTQESEGGESPPPDESLSATQQQKEGGRVTPPLSPTTKTMPKSVLKLRKTPSIDEQLEEKQKWRFPGDKKVRFDTKLPKLYAELPAEDWLPSDLKRLYLRNFIENGYDNVSFIAGMTNKELRSIGIRTRGHRMQLVYAIERIPHVPLVTDVPENVEDWLHDLGLECYWDYFVENGYSEPRILEDLKAMDGETLKQTLKEDLHINKPGHLNKIIKAIKKLQYPTPSQRGIRRARELVKEAGALQDLETINQDDGHEYQFWKGLREACLLPESAVFGAVTELKEQLEDLRDSWLMMFAIANAIWMILIVTLVKLPDLNFLGTNVLGLAFLAVYGLIIVIQFLTLIWHRLNTWCHMIARSPWTRGPYKMAWAFNDDNLPPEPTQAELERVRVRRHKVKKKRRTGRRHSSTGSDSASTALLCESQSDYGSANQNSLTANNYGGAHQNSLTANNYGGSLVV